MAFLRTACLWERKKNVFFLNNNNMLGARRCVQYNFNIYKKGQQPKVDLIFTYSYLDRPNHIDKYIKAHFR